MVGEVNKPTIQIEQDSMFMLVVLLIIFTAAVSFCLGYIHATNQFLPLMGDFVWAKGFMDGCANVTGKCLR